MEMSRYEMQLVEMASWQDVNNFTSQHLDNLTSLHVNKLHVISTSQQLDISRCQQVACQLNISTTWHLNKMHEDAPYRAPCHSDWLWIKIVWSQKYYNFHRKCVADSSLHDYISGPKVCIGLSKTGIMLSGVHKWNIRILRCRLLLDSPILPILVEGQVWVGWKQLEVGTSMRGMGMGSRNYM